MPRTHGAKRISASAGPPPPPKSYAHQAALAANNGQPLPFGAGIGEQSVFHFAGGQSNPTGCVRAPYDEWYVDETECLNNIPDGYQCNPRFINGVWDRYTPYARDSEACHGNLPPDILPQVLDSTSLVDTEIFQYAQNPILSLNTNGLIGELTFDFTNADTGSTTTVDIQWSQDNNVISTLFNPVSYYYAVPFGTGVARLALNTLNGHATATFPFQGFLAKITFQMTNIMPWQSTQTPNQASVRLHKMSVAQIG